MTAAICFIRLLGSCDKWSRPFFSIEDEIHIGIIKRDVKVGLAVLPLTDGKD
jgi:hypothetical protein